MSDQCESERQGANMTWIVDFDYRSDDGPRIVGPFDTREQAQSWTDGLRGPGWEAEFCIVPLAAPVPT